MITAQTKTLLFFLLHAVSSFSYSQSGNLDATFGANGVVTTPIGTSSVIRDMAIQTDGKIIAAGYSSDGITPEFSLVRYHVNGTLDSTFDADGKVTTNFGSEAEIYAIAIQSDGKIVAAGYRYNDSTWEFAIARYNTNGSPDSSFNNDGKANAAIGLVDDRINAVAIQADGKIVVGGYTNTAPDINYYEPEIALMRYNINGYPDSTFGIDGKVITQIGSLYDILYSIAIQPDGKIVGGGTYLNGSNHEYLIVRYNTNGTLDNTFSTDGIVTTVVSATYDLIHSIALQTDGKIVASGISGVGSVYDFSLARYNTDGTLDNTFDGDGILITPIGSFLDISTCIALESNGKILIAAGVSDSANNHDLYLVRYNTDGSIDSTFDTDGKVVSDINGNDLIYTIKLFASRIYVAGSNDQFLIAAYQNDIFTLPINLFSFTAFQQRNIIMLQWEASLQNSFLFTIERSSNGRNFSDIGKVNSGINGSFQSKYVYADVQPMQGINFYRIKMTEANNSSIYSNVVAVKMNAFNILMKIFPNPAAEKLQVQIPASQNEKAILFITDIHAKTIKKQHISLSEGAMFSTTINISDLKKGTYFLSVKSNTKSKIQKFVKQ